MYIRTGLLVKLLFLILLICVIVVVGLLAYFFGQPETTVVTKDPY